MRAPVQLGTCAIHPEELAIMWGLPLSTVVNWINGGAIGSNAHRQLTRREVLVFINSQAGQTLLRDARS